MTVIYSIGNLLTSSFYLSYLPVLPKHFMVFMGLLTLHLCDEVHEATCALHVVV